MKEDHQNIIDAEFAVTVGIIQQGPIFTERVQYGIQIFVNIGKKGKNVY